MNIDFFGKNWFESLFGLALMVFSGTVLTFLHFNYPIFDLIEIIIFYPCFFVGMLLFFKIFLTSENTEKKKKGVDK